MFNPKTFIGQHIDQFRLDEFIAMGAMGLVFKAYDTILKRTVALKLIHKTEDITPAMDGARSRLIKEARAAARLSHVNIVTIYSYGETDLFQYIAMEYVTGTTLAEILNRRGMLPLEETVALFDQILLALEAADREQIVHRDIKPANIMITGGNRVKVADFGVAKLGRQSSTRTGTVLGTPNYMSPEQIQGKQVDIRADLFSLGVVLYQTLTGAKPFEGDSITTLIYKIIHEEPVPPTIVNNRLPKTVEAVIQKSLSKNADDRYQTPGEMRQAILLLVQETAVESDFEANVATVVDAGFGDQKRPDEVGRGDTESKGLDVKGFAIAEQRTHESISPGEEVQPVPLEPVPQELSREVRVGTEAQRKWSQLLRLTVLSVSLALAVTAFYFLSPFFFTREPPAKSSPAQSASQQAQIPLRPTTPTETVEQQRTARQGQFPGVDWSTQAQYEIGLRLYKGIGQSRDYQKALILFQQAADGGYAPARYMLGIMYENGYGVEKNYPRAMSWYRKAADQGYSKAESRLGQMYLSGIGVEKNYQEALRWFGKAAEQGNEVAQNNLGYMYRRGLGVHRDYQESLKWFIKAADQGYLKAQANVGYMYRRGFGVQMDYQEALRWFRKAAEQGDPYAEANLGHMYLRGLGVKKDYQEALRWYRKAAELGEGEAQNNLGYMYQNGFGVEIDYQEALKWYRKSAATGNSDSLTSLGNMYRNGFGVQKDYQEALRLYRQAAEDGNSNAQVNLGFMHQNGLGVQVNYQEAISWYAKGAEQDNDVAQNNLGHMYENGLGVSKNYQEAMKWYLKAADQGNDIAQNSLGRMNEKGLGVKPDIREAKRWYQKAADQGNKKALEALKRLR